MKDNNKIDVAHLIEEFKQNWLLFAISLFTCILLAGVYLYRKHSVYSVTAKVLVAQDEGSGSMGATLMQSLSLGGVGGNSIEDEVIVMGSHTIKKQTINELKLNRSYSSKENLLRTRYYYNDSPIEIDAPDALFDTLSIGMRFTVDINDAADEIKVKVKKGMFKTLTEITATSFPFVVNTPYGIFSVDTTKFYIPGEAISIKVDVTGNSILAEAYTELLSVSKVDKKSNGINLFIEDINIERGTDVLNKMIELYNRRGQQEKDEMAINTGKFIEERLNYLYTDLSKSEEKIEKFKQSKNIANVEAQASYLMGRTNSLENQLVNAETEFEILSMTREFLSNPENKYSLIPNVSGSGIAGSAISGYNALVLDRLKLMNNAKANNKALKAIEDQLDTLQASIVETLNKSYETSLFRLNELKSQTNKSQAKLSGVPTQEREYLELLREQTIRNSLYSFLLQKREENQLVLAATTPKGKIVDSAFAYNEPIAPNKFLVVLVAIFMGVMIPVGYLYVKHILRSKFATKEEVERLTDAPILGEMCTSDREETLVVKSGGSSSAAELFRLIRSNLQFILGGMNDKVVVVTSTVSGEGKSFISINLAASLAMLGKKVLLVGMDIRAPKLADYLNLKINKGLTEYLSSQSIDLDDIIIKNAVQENMDIIVSGPVPPNPSELLASPTVDQLFSALREKYDYIIVDSAPVGMVSDTFSLTRISDATVYVCRANYTNLKDIEYINSLYADNRLKRMSLVVNGTETKKGYGYGYGQNKV